MESMQKLIQQHIKDSIETKLRMEKEQGPVIARISQSLIKVLGAGGTIYLCGNGGSAADAQHVAAEFVGRFLRKSAGRCLPCADHEYLDSNGYWQRLRLQPGVLQAGPRPGHAA